MISQLGYLIFKNDYYGIFILSDLPINVVKNQVFNSTYIVSENFLVLFVPLPDSDEETCLVFPLNKIKNYPFHLLIYMFHDVFSEAECIAAFRFTERDIGEAQGYYKALARMSKNKKFLVESESPDHDLNIN